MNRRRPIIFWPLVVLAVCATSWWTFHVPYEPERILSAIPVQASYLSVHRNLAARWDDISSSPLTRALFVDAGMRAGDWQDLNSDPQFRDWLGRLASDEFALAYVPDLAVGKSGWVFASWLGGRSQRLRLALQMSDIPGIKYIGSRHGWPVWVASSKMFRGGDVLAFSLVEGMIVASYAKTPQAIDTVLACVDGRYPSLTIHKDAGAIPPREPADRGWFRVPDSAKGIIDAPRARFALTQFSSNNLRGTLSLPYTWLDGAPQISAPAPAAIASWQTDLPASVFIAPSTKTRDWLRQSGTNALVRAAADLIGEQADGPLFASLFGRDYRGVMFGLKIPALLVAASSTNVAALPSQLNAHLDAINAANRWALAPDETTAGSARVWMIRATNDSIYAQAERGEQIGIAAGSDWLLAASNVHAFTNVLRDAILREQRPARVALAAEAAAREHAAAFAWINLPETCPALKMAFGSYILRLRMENTPRSLALRNQLNDALSWIYNLEPFGSIELAARPEAGSTRIDFRTVPAAP